jgi:hypothetical protein
MRLSYIAFIGKFVLYVGTVTRSMSPACIGSAELSPRRPGVMLTSVRLRARLAGAPSHPAAAGWSSDHPALFL